MGKFDSKSDDSVFLGYSLNSKAYQVYNMRTQTIMKSSNVVVDDTNDLSEFSKEESISSLMESIGDEVLSKGQKHQAEVNLIPASLLQQTFLLQ